MWYFQKKMSAEKGCIFSSMYDFEFQFSCVSARAQYILEPLKRKNNKSKLFRTIRRILWY